MDKNKVFKIGDKVQVEDGRVGVVIHIEEDPITQGAIGSQQLVLKFSDQSTQLVTSSNLQLSKPSAG